MNKRFQLGCVFLLLLSGELASAQQQENVLNYNVIQGAASPTLKAVLDKVEVQRLLLDLARQPRPQDFLDSALRDSSISRPQLETLGLVRREGENYVISFLLFTSQDMIRMREITEAQARTLAGALLTRRAEMEDALKQHSPPGIDPSAVAYILLGCFSLDWDGLDLTAEKGYWSRAEREREDGRAVVWAWEPTELSNKGLYWGSHNSSYGDASFTSFGDHYIQPRLALPDLLWSLPRRATQGNWPEPLKAKVQAVMQVSLGTVGERMGLMMLALRDGDKTLPELARAAGIETDTAAPLAALLVELGYVTRQGEQYQARVPVLHRRDVSLVRQIRRIGWQVMEQWLAANYDSLKKELSQLTPFRYGVPLTDMFWWIWHYIFGAANRRLVEAGFFADPYAESRGARGVIPVVFHRSLRTAR